MSALPSYDGDVMPLIIVCIIILFVIIIVTAINFNTEAQNVEKSFYKSLNCYELKAIILQDPNVENIVFQSYEENCTVKTDIKEQTTQKKGK